MSDVSWTRPGCNLTTTMQPAIFPVKGPPTLCRTQFLAVSKLQRPAMGSEEPKVTTKVLSGLKLRTEKFAGI